VLGVSKNQVLQMQMQNRAGALGSECMPTEHSDYSAFPYILQSEQSEGEVHTDFQMHALQMYRFWRSQSTSVWAVTELWMQSDSVYLDLRILRLMCISFLALNDLKLSIIPFHAQRPFGTAQSKGANMIWHADK